MAATSYCSAEHLRDHTHPARKVFGEWVDRVFGAGWFLNLLADSRLEGMTAINEGGMVHMRVEFTDGSQITKGWIAPWASTSTITSR